MNLCEEIIQLFDDVGWTETQSYVRYSAISRSLHLWREKKGNQIKTRASAIERCVRKLRQDGYLERKELNGEVCWRRIK